MRVPVRDDFTADAAAMTAAITPHTVLVVGSAPQYPQGVVDPIDAIAALAAARDINCHVDACMGGITLPMLERLGYPIPPFDFRVPGVTSMSVDLHKYGYTAKGASVIVHRSKELRKQQTFTTDNWLGGLYGSSGVLGTRSGGPIAAAWAVMHYLGEPGYLRLTRQARQATERLLAALRATPGVRVLGEPAATLVAFTVDDADTFAVGNALAQARLGARSAEPAAQPALHRQRGARRRHRRVGRRPACGARRGAARAVGGEAESLRLARVIARAASILSPSHGEMDLVRLISLTPCPLPRERVSPCRA